MCVCVYAVQVGASKLLAGRVEKSTSKWWRHNKGKSRTCNSKHWCFPCVLKDNIKKPFFWLHYVLYFFFITYITSYMSQTCDVLAVVIKSWVQFKNIIILSFIKFWIYVQRVSELATWADKSQGHLMPKLWVLSLPSLSSVTLVGFLCLSYYRADNWTVTLASQWAKSRWQRQSLSGITTENIFRVFRDENGRFHALTLTVLLSKLQGWYRCVRKQEAWKADLANIYGMPSMLFFS